MDNKRPTIIDFVEKYTSVYADKTFLREKVDGKWTETSFRKTRNEGRILAAGFMSLGLQKGEKVSLLSATRTCFSASTTPTPASSWPRRAR